MDISGFFNFRTLWRFLAFESAPADRYDTFGLETFLNRENDDFSFLKMYFGSV